jgi:hypothetical protein
MNFLTDFFLTVCYLVLLIFVAVCISFKSLPKFLRLSSVLSGYNRQVGVQVSTCQAQTKVCTPARFPRVNQTLKE